MEHFFNVLKLITCVSYLLFIPERSALSTISFIPLTLTTSEFNGATMEDMVTPSVINCALKCKKKKEYRNNCNAMMYNTGSNVCSLIYLKYAINWGNVFNEDYNFFVKGNTSKDYWLGGWMARNSPLLLRDIFLLKVFNVSVMYIYWVISLYIIYTVFHFR